MNINVSKKSYFTAIAFLIVILYGAPFVKANATTNLEAYNSLNFETRNFVGRLDQLPQNFTFNKNLKKGTPVTPDVQNLKWILNSDTRTALTDNPNMTLTELTSAYGPLTESAVKRFQTVYKSEILDPQGIKSATGIVGKGTRQKLNWLLSHSRVFYTEANNALANSANNYNNSNYSNSNYANNNYSTNFIDFSNIENFINNSGFVQTYATTTGSYSTNGTTSTSTGTALYTSAQITTNGTTNTGSSISSSDDSSSGGLGILAIVGGAALLGSAAGNAGGTAASNASQAALGQFGGKITMNMVCPCSANYMITLNDLSTKMPLSIMFQPGVSSLKMNYNPTIGESVLGGYIRGAATCMVYVGTGCSSYGNPSGTIDTMRGVGTTLTPAK
jgi:hypothetical protein